MSSRLLRSVIIASSLTAALSAVPSIWSQTGSVLQRLPSHSETGWANAANRWQLTAIDPSAQIDTVSPTVRAERNAYWKGPLEAFWPLWERVSEGGGGIGGGGGMLFEDDPEFPPERGATWAIATFEAFHVFAVDPDFRLIYTEMNFRVDQVLKTPPGLSLSDGSTVDVGIPGGRIKLPSGEINSFQIFPAPYYFQVGHKYLVQFLYQSQGDFFLPNKRWDVSSGKVQPDDSREIARAARGKSTIAGMSLVDVVNYLPSVLPEEPKK